MRAIKAKIENTIIIALLLIASSIVICHIFFMKVSVTSGSMEPTIMTGDHLIIKKTKKIERGDVVCFKSDELGRVLVKRLIGVAGDTIEIKAGTVLINGEELREDYVSTSLNYNGHFEVPDDCYFFLGDNRADSFDARFWANPYINKHAIIGKSVLNLSR